MKNLLFIIATFALLYGCQGHEKATTLTSPATLQGGENVALLYEAGADTTAHNWYLSDPARRVVQPKYTLFGKRFNHVVGVDTLSQFMAAHPKAVLVWRGLYSEVRDSIRETANVQFISRHSKQPE
jgi:hypothetical protein